MIVPPGMKLLLLSALPTAICCAEFRSTSCEVGLPLALSSQPWLSPRDPAAAIEIQSVHPASDTPARPKRKNPAPHAPCPAPPAAYSSTCAGKSAQLQTHPGPDE